MSAHSSSTLDLIVETIGRLGFLEGDAAVFRVLTTQPMRTALYYLGEEIVVVGWSEGSTLYQLSATSETVARLLRHELGDAGLLCDATGVLLEVRGQEYIDDEVRRMLAAM